MARKDMPIDNEESNGGFERILFFLIPIIFTIVLVGVLLTLFNINVRNGVLDLANKVPIVKNWVPDPVLSPEEKKLKEIKEQEESSEATIKELKKQLAEKEESLKEMSEQKTEQESKVKKLQTQMDDMQRQRATDEPEEDPYTKQIQDLAKLYADMSPSKAAPIMQNLTLEEMVLMFSEMKSARRVAILEKMDPKTAAEATMMLKDAVPAEDLAIAALQSRLKKNESTKDTPKTTNNLDKNQLVQTFSQMTPKNASDLLLQTYKISPEKAITILNTVDDSTRAKILNAMSTSDAELTAKILNRLMGAK
ncbi:magnesium transporter MgtE N-terminal domain-containing protein [Paenibacillus sp. GCM10028914]|uniref:magnesium transporter MgtE N-terminal domain-containing protein n=1 Tax=Paenibacillus sp. GCM10028914 TaxID=3273416 RepID=UPI00361524EF